MCWLLFLANTLQEVRTGCRSHFPLWNLQELTARGTREEATMIFAVGLCLAQFFAVSLYDSLLLIRSPTLRRSGT